MSVSFHPGAGSITSLCLYFLLGTWWLNAWLLIISCCFLEKIRGSEPSLINAYSQMLWEFYFSREKLLLYFSMTQSLKTIKLLSNRLGITLCTLISQSLSFTVHYDIIIKMSYREITYFLTSPPQLTSGV